MKTEVKIYTKFVYINIKILSSSLIFCCFYLFFTLWWFFSQWPVSIEKKQRPLKNLTGLFMMIYHTPEIFTFLFYGVHFFTLLQCSLSLQQCRGGWNRENFIGIDFFEVYQVMRENFEILSHFTLTKAPFPREIFISFQSRHNSIRFFCKNLRMKKKFSSQYSTGTNKCALR